MVRIAASILVLLSFMASALAQFPPDSRMKTVADTKTVKIAYRTDAVPFSFLSSANEPAGYSVDVCKLVVASIARQLGVDRLEIAWVPVTVQSRFAAIASGKADMECGSSTVTLSRMKEVDFSNFIFLETTGMVVSRAANVRSFADMTGKRMAAIAGTSNEQALIAQLKAQKVEAILFAVKDASEGIAMLEAGNVDAYASDKLLLAGASMKSPEKFAMLPDDLSVEPYAIVLPRGDWAFRLAVNTGLAQIYRSGEVAVVFRKWFERIGLQIGPVLRTMYGLGAVAD